MSESHGQAPVARALPEGSGTTGGPTTAQRTATRWRSGVPLVELPFMPPLDPTSAIMRQPLVPEEKRFCPGCRLPVGRSRDRRPGRVTGFCSKCRTRYSFMPALAPRDLLAGQYRVLGCLAYGGLGWIYLAQDERVSRRWVVLKGVLNSGDSAMAAALAERQFLARVEHPNVVRIYNVVEHSGGGYIVMEYVGGRTLKTVVRERVQAGLGPLPVDLAIAYTLAVLPAFRYLHEIGLAYNDFKLDNVMLQGADVKLIDLGAVTRLDDPDPVVFGTDGYQAPEMGSRARPSVAADLYSIARALAVLVLDLPAFQTTYRHRLPTPAEEPLFLRHESLYRFLMKATAHDPRDRYQSADEMAEALEPVLREVTAASQGGPRPAPSRLFGGDVLPIRWAAGGAGAGPDWRHLPAPRVDPADPAADYALDALVLEPAHQVTVLREVLAQRPADSTVEARLALARALIELGQHAEAETNLAWLEARDRREWRGNWYRGVSLLAQGRPAEAGLAFDLVYAEFPGELAPKLALALAAELAGDVEAAERHYDVVSSTDPGFASASFGLARARLAMGDVAGAVQAYERIPPTSSLHAHAQLALARALIRGGRSTATADDLVRAASVIERLQLPPEPHAEMAVELFEAALTLVGPGRPKPAEVRLLGQSLRETPIRLALERAYRDLAWTAVGLDKVLLVECANEVRPVTSR